MNAIEIEEAVSELAASPFDAAEFPFTFLLAFGNTDTTVNRLRKGETNKSDVENGILQRNKIHIAIAEPGQTGEVLQRLLKSLQTARQKAKFILATDGAQVEAEDLTSGELLVCAYSELGNRFGFFLPLAGISTTPEIKDNPIDIKATRHLNKLYVELLDKNEDWGTPERRQDLNRFMARMIFCFFAEDTGIFSGGNLFNATLQQMTEADGSNTSEVLKELFRAMNLDPRKGERKDVRPWADVFPYVNGGLFNDAIDCPRFGRTARAYLLRAGELDWKTINPDIFGSMIQAVADDDERGELGMHYTSVPNIQKVLDPLFLDDLREQLEAAGTNKRKLFNLRQRLSRIRVFDPACGSGNFLVIAYIRMREIEDEIMRRRGEGLIRSAISLTQFFGIEIKSFAAEIARLSLLIAEFQCDVRFIGQAEARALVLPLHATGNIITGNALRLDWEEVCPPVTVSMEEHDLGGPTGRLALEGGGQSETFICGNPPYAGLSSQIAEQKADLGHLFDGISRYWKSFDYVFGWFWKARGYGRAARSAAAFVSTNSICQGQQVPMFWPLILDNEWGITFAHMSFKWKNLAANNAGVTVVVVGIGPRSNGRSRIFNHDIGSDVMEARVENINAYLVPGPDTYVEPLSKPPSGRPVMYWGNKPTDGGNLIMSPDEARAVKAVQPVASGFLRPFYGSSEFISGQPRVCIWVEEPETAVANGIPELAQRFDAVRKFRSASKAKETRPAAAYPHRFRQVQGHPGERAIVIPIHTSEARDYLPVGVLPPGTIVSNAAYAIYGTSVVHISLIASRLHLVWIATVCGKLKTDFRYSNTLGWNTFPVPKLTEQNKVDLTRCAEDILLAREAHFPATIAELYDPEEMPGDLRTAHERNDETLERIYIGRRFRNDTERLEKLFDMYTKMTSKQAE